MQTLLPLATELSALLRQRGETVAVAESAAGGLVSAALLAVPGASAYFLGGAVVYTRDARATLLDIPASALADIRPSTEPYALLLARGARTRLGASWGLGETGAAGPAGNRYGDPAGHACVAISGPGGGGSAGLLERSLTLATGSDDRAANMRAFAHGLLSLLLAGLRESAG
ncbi:CinA family protein [Roseomonas sp. NAR14]|uniref:CinA family protein n=1 Tax=Roseomonas acroporae TaxID=2937791 RepID=A0A9X1YB45_9PROT|nr:CinA family protein [Roseomonas acroporae]MCK8786843.1 CinA family protein [Roseomonas acroporae]